jgi:hypothetical protein
MFLKRGAHGYTATSNDDVVRPFIYQKKFKTIPILQPSTCANFYEVLERHKKWHNK